MSEPGYVVVTKRRDKHLSLVLEASKRLAVNAAVSVALKISAQRARLFDDCAAFALPGFGGVSRKGFFAVFQAVSNKRLYHSV